ncbi:J domain-containing protein [Pelomonas sp. APW6]|uniref:J domain-containing protein n=1 Tax=Roseateles subflavus TaxID=3053353 RepID=A0ABT7LI21_9BURK|nr:J domain-containing protein [Pelomonas sp. APW6]MDL5032079.1 J domain-containing protein [Pelomonas sp. APW6]
MNHYDTLEVSSRASPEVLRAAYRSLMQRYHPDRHPDDPQAAARTAAITEAYDVLSDPARRAAYDEALAAQQASAVPAGAHAAGAAAAGSSRGARSAGAAGAASAGRTRGGARGPARAATPVSLGRWAIGLVLALGAAALVGHYGAQRPAEGDDWAALRQRFSAGGHTEDELREMLRRKEALLQQSPALRERDDTERARDLEARTFRLLDAKLEIYLGTGVLTVPQIELVLGSFDAQTLRSYLLKNRELLVGDVTRALNNANVSNLVGAAGEQYVQTLIQDTLVKAMGSPPEELYPSTWHESPGRYGLLRVQLPQHLSYRPYNPG